MIDIHCHVLPGVDDGVPDVSAAEAFCKLAAKDGIREIIATPHQRHPSWANENTDVLRNKFTVLKEQVSKWVTLHLGAEIRLDSGLIDEIDRGAVGHVLPLAESRYLLIEFPRIDTGLPAEEILHELMIAGYQPILAHPELIPYLANDPGRLEGLLGDGSLLQVTGMSITGDFGKGPQATVWSLLHRGWVHFVASDAHSSDWRPPLLSRARQALSDDLGEEVATLLTEENPAKILSDEKLEGLV